jgi:hypothetical protein
MRKYVTSQAVPMQENGQYSLAATRKTIAVSDG